MLPRDKIYTSDEAIVAICSNGKKDAARQKIRRAVAGGKLWRSEKLVLQRNRRLMCNKSFLRSKDFIPQVQVVLARERKSLARATKALKHKKILLAFELARVLGSPVEDDGKKKYPTWRKEFEALVEIRCGVLEAMNEKLERLKFPKIKADQATAIAIERCAELSVAQQMAEVVMRQLRKQNLISWGDPPGVQRGEYGVVFNNYAFSEAGFTWLRPTNFRPTSRGEQKPVPMVMDCYARRVELYDVESFLVRLERAGELNKKRQTFYGILVGQHFTKEAWQRAKEEGLHLINLGQMFGDETLKLVQRYSKLACSVTGNMQLLDSAELEGISNSLNDLKTNPIVKDLRSIGLEILTALLLRSESFENVAMNVNVPFKDTTRDVDAAGKKRVEGKVIYRVVECKAYSSEKDLAEEEIEKFFLETVPSALKYYNERDSGCMVEAEIWTTGKVGKVAQDRLDKMQLCKRVVPRLRELVEVKKLVPLNMKPAKKLLDVIAEGLT